MIRTRGRGRGGWTSPPANKLDYRPRIPLAVAMRVKDEEKYIGESLKSLQALDCPIVFLDDGSTDQTPEIAQSFENVLYTRQDLPFDELRDRDFLFRYTMSLYPKWVLNMDGDEVLPHRSPQAIRYYLDNIDEDTNVIRMMLIWIWLGGDGQEWYIDRYPGPIYHQRIYRAADVSHQHKLVPVQMIGAPRFENGLHCNPIPLAPSQWVMKDAPIVIKEYGYETRGGYEESLGFFNKQDQSMWSQNEIIERALHPIAPWNDEMVPQTKTREEHYEFLMKRLNEGLARWEKTSEQGKGKETHKELSKSKLVKGGLKKGRPKKVRSEARC